MQHVGNLTNQPHSVLPRALGISHENGGNLQPPAWMESALVDANVTRMSKRLAFPVNLRERPRDLKRCGTVST
jgi:hypothetical protein